MSRWLSTVLALFMVAGAATLCAAEPADSPGDGALKSGILHLEQTEYSEALKAFERALDLFAGSQRLEDAQRAYMQLFVAHRSHANVLMKAMKTWVEKHRANAGGLAAPVFAAFDGWVKERDALATATINLVHNSPDWK